MFASSPRGRRLTTSPRLAGCPLRMHRGQPALGRHQPVSILVETSAGCCCRGSRDSSASESVCLRRGGHPAERAGSGAWVGTPGPVDCPCLDERPPFQYLVNTNSRRVSSPRGVAQCLVPRKNPSGIFINIFFHILYPLAYACSMCACISLSSYSDTEQIQR